MSSIDERIVRMRFDNAGFQNGVSSTLSSLKRLNESLKMKSSSKGLEEVNSSINKLSSSGLTGLSNGVQTVTSRFSALQVMGVTALANITNSAVNAGKNLVKSFTLDPIKEGFSEYELKMNSIQTILTNTKAKGTTLTDVNKALNELNEYSDKTIYNFAQMTDNIGKATAAGLGLEESVTFVKGMSNAAAGFGVDATRMAGATYQMTQALAAGVVKLQDWRSLEQAGMGGEMMQQEMIKAAEGMGIVVDKSKPFRESLQQGWLTSEVFIKAMQNMANDPSLTDAAKNVTSFTKLLGTMKETLGSGWSTTFEHIFGNKEQSTKLWTDMSNAFGELVNESAKARNEVLKQWNEGGGRDSVIKGLSNMANSIGKVFGSIGSAFKDIFPPMTGQRLIEISNGFKDLTEKFKITDSTAAKIKSTFEGLFSVIKLLLSPLKLLPSVLSSGLSVFGSVGKVILSVTSGIGKFVSAIAEGVSSADIFGKLASGIDSAMSTVSSAIDKGFEAISNFFKGIGNFDFGTLGTIFEGLGAGIGNIISGLGEGLGKLNFDGFFSIINGLLAGKLIQTISGLGDSVGGGLKGIIDTLISPLKELTSIPSNITSTLDSVKETLQSYQTNLNAGTLIKLASAIGILAGSLFVLSTIKPEKLETALAGISMLFVELIASLAVMLKVVEGNKLKGILKLSTSLLVLSGAVLVLSGAMKMLSTLDWQGVAKGLVSIAGILTALVATSKYLDTSSKGMIKTATGMVIMAAAVSLLATAVRKLGTLKPETLTKGLVGVGVALAELSIFMKKTDFTGMGLKSATSILIMSGAINALAVAVKSFASMNPTALVQGLVGVGAVLAELVAFSKLVGKPEHIIKTASGLLVLSVAMNVLSGAVRSFGSMNWNELAVGLSGMAAALVTVGVAGAKISGGKLVLASVGISAMSIALQALSAALKSMGSMSWEQLATGLTALAGSLLILGVAMTAMKSGIPGAAAMLVMAGALALLTPQLVALGQLSLAQIGTALLALAGAFGALGLAAVLLTPVLPALLGLAAVITLLGAGCLAAGAGITAFATGIGLLATVGAAGGTVLIGIFKELIALLPQLGAGLAGMLVSFATALAQAIPQLVTAFTGLITALLTSFTNALPQIATAAMSLITTICTVITQALPQLVTLGVNVILKLLEGILSNIDKLVNVGSKIIVGFINGIAQNIGQIIQAGINLAIQFIEGVADGLIQNQERLSSAVGRLIEAMLITAGNLIGKGVGSFISGGAKLVTGLVSGIGSGIGKAATTVSQGVSRAASNIGSHVGKFISGGAKLVAGLARGIAGAVGRVLSAIASLIGRAVSAIASAVGRFLSAGRNLISSMARGITSGVGACISAVRSIISRIASTVASGASKLVSAGKNLIAGLGRGIISGASSVISSAKNVANRVVSNVKGFFKIKSPSRVFMGIGKFLDLGLAKGIKKFANVVDEPTKNLANRAISKVSNTISKVAEVLNNDVDPNPTITPVIDLEKIKQGSKTIGQLLAANDGIELSTDISGGITKSIGSIQNGNPTQEIVDAINDLRDSMPQPSGDTYQIDGVTYDDGTNVSTAVKTLVRAAKIERRV